jgi:hypothetical protein
MPPGLVAQDFMMASTDIMRFFASLHHPYTDGHRYPPAKVVVKVKKRRLVNGVLEVTEEERQSQQPGSLKPHNFTLHCTL